MLLVAVEHVSAGTVRQLQRRDVSHLPLEYLPPVALPPIPSREYLPPVEQHAASLPQVLEPPRDYLPAVEPAEQLKVSNEYLPPDEEEDITTTEEPAPTTTTTPIPITTTIEPAELETEAPVELQTHEELAEPSGVLQADGYHYATPEIIPDLAPAASPVEAYLPPLDDNEVVVAEVPQSEESAALLDDGYHYRAIRRLRL
ncbi:diacylglycerol kinase kappa [Drosophila grimshawi]|uniref:GH15582 n=1 Tax=Drosophila grimshawi TaxID=7222 RepID=B4J0W5_DROGR|nr:diacylglycerol kinase kappa [Drosophila grimshawi]EDV95786.1 GH15582 [Drosophila grimshawi]